MQDLTVLVKENKKFNKNQILGIKHLKTGVNDKYFKRE